MKEGARRKSVETAVKGKKMENPGKAKKVDGGTRRKSGEGDRAAFLKSVFGGGT